MKKRYTYRKYDRDTYPGHLSEQFDIPQPGLSEAELETMKSVLAEDEAKMSDKDRLTQAVKAYGQPGFTKAHAQDHEVDTTPWMPELYGNSGDDDDPISGMSK